MEKRCAGWGIIGLGFLRSTPDEVGTGVADVLACSLVEKGVCFSSLFLSAI